MAKSKVFYDLTGNENIINQLEKLVSEFKAKGITGTVVIPDYAHVYGNITLDAITVAILAYDRENRHKLYDFWETYKNEFVDIRPLTAKLIESNAEIYADYKGVLRYDF